MEFILLIYITLHLFKYLLNRSKKNVTRKILEEYMKDRVLQKEYILRKISYFFTYFSIK